jgi:hypothetical protein
MRDGDAPVVRPLAPYWQKRRRLAVIAACALSIPVWYTRNVASDAAFFDSTMRVKSADAYNAYIREGWRSVDVVKQELPRVAFEEVRETKSAKTLRDYVKRYPDSPFAAEATKTLGALYDEAAENYRRQGRGVDPKAQGGIEQLLEYAEKTGSTTLTIVTEGPSAEQLKAADRRAQAMLQTPQDLAMLAVWARPLTIPLAQRLAKSLDAAFSVVFPARLMTVQQMPSLAAKADGPRLVVTYNVIPGGTFYTHSAKKDGTIFTGMTVTLRTRLLLAGSDPVFETLFAVPPADDFRVPEKQGLVVATDVYNAMLTRAFDDAAPKFVGLFFDASSTAYARATASASGASQ